MVEFCEKVGNRDDIWYVGSGEFIDYLEALDKVAVSNNEIVNPIENDLVWIELSSGFKQSKPGEKIKVKTIKSVDVL